MPSVNLTDQVGIEVNVELNKDSAIAKYIEGLKKMKLPALTFAGIQDITLDQAPLKSLETGIVFEQPVDVGIDGSEMKIGAGVSGSIKLFTPKDETLFDPDVFGDPIGIGANQLYLGVETSATLSSELTHKTGDLGFGFNAGSQIALATYTSFERPAAGAFPNSLAALKEAIASFVIPGDLEDLMKMANGSVATVEGKGSIKFSSAVNVLSVVNPLAAVNLPEPIGAVKVTSGNAIKVGASFEISGAYQIRAQKVTAEKIRLGYYKKRGTEFSLKVSAAGGLAVGVGDFEIIEKLLTAVSSNPQVDAEELKKGGLNEGQIEAIKKVVEAGISRKLEIALGFELSSAESSEAAFLFEIELGKLDEAGRKAVHQALDGDLSGLAARPEELPAGISLVRSIFTEIQKKKHALKFNLLGIYNFISVSTLVLRGTVMFEPATGEVIITDKATASRIAASTLNFAADSEKLRKVLAESVLITAAYRCSKLVTHQPELKIAHSYFELHSKTDRTVMKNNLDVLESLGLMKATEKAEVLSGATQFGRSTFYAETGYDDEFVSHLFLSGGEPRTQDEYERAGRKALTLLVQEGESDEVRRLPASDNDLWKEMAKEGQPGFKFIEKLKNLSPAALGAITSDYTVIIWWAESMKEMSEKLAEVRQFIKDNPGVDPENNTFKSLRKKLASKLRDVAGNTKSEFGDPWGLVAMDQASGGRASAKTLVTGGTVMQFRYSTTSDPGRAITSVLRARANEGTHTLASLLQASNLDHLRHGAKSLPYRQSVLTMWVRVPPKKRGNSTMSAMANFKKSLNEEVKMHGILSTLRRLPAIYAETADDSVVRRTLEDERRAYSHTNRVWRQIENSSPLMLRRFTRQEIWQAVFFGHCQNVSSAPILPEQPGRDLRDYLCGETIAGELNYLLHGDYPVAIVSMFTPPNEFVTADALRGLIGRRDFNSRHTIVTEFLFPEQRKETKRLDRRIKQVKRTFTKRDNPEGAAALRSLRAVRDEVAGARESLLPTRFYVVLYGERARNLAELKQSVDALDEQCERLVSAIRQIPGANAEREEPEALRALYQSAIAGELSPKLTGRELTEVSNSVVALTPTEDSWQGAARPHTLLATVTGRLIGIDLFDRNQIPSPLIQIIAAPRGGKSILMAQFACDILASMRDASVNAIDIGETLRPLVTVLGGRYIRPRPDEVRAINIWSYPELRDGQMPDDAQKALVVGDLKMLARLKDDDKTAEDIIGAVVAQVYENIVSQNGPGRPLFEPVLSHFVAQLRTYPFDSEMVRERRETLVLALSNYLGHPWLDAPTHPDYEAKSAFDVFELGSLKDFPQDIKLSLAYRIAAHVARCIGRRRADGTRAPTANLFDEMWEIKEEYPFIFKVLQHAGRKGPKENSITILATHAFEDIEDVASLSKTGNVIFVGKQLGDYSKIVAHANLSENGALAIGHLKNAPGRFSQFVMVIGSGPDQVVEVVQHELSPLMLWTLTTNADERNARSVVSAYHPEWSEMQVHAWLAQHYPRGLTAAGLREIDESLLEVAA